MAHLKAEKPNPEEDFMGYTLMTLSLDARHDIVQMFKEKGKPAEKKYFEDVAREYYAKGKNRFDELNDKQKKAVTLAMEWIYEHRFDILEHKVMRDQNLRTNIWKWQRGGHAECDDWTYYTLDEKKLLWRESKFIALERHNKK